MVKLLSILGIATYVITIYATNLNVNIGCILANNKSVCSGRSVLTVYNNVTIYARYDGNDEKSEYSLPRCKLDVSWDPTYGDVYYGKDDCLHTGSNSGSVIIDCCDEQSGLQLTINPYNNRYF